MSRSIYIDGGLGGLTSNGFSLTAKEKTADSSDYREILKSLQQKAAATKAAESPLDIASMTMQDYQTYVGEKLQSLSQNSSRSQSATAVIISDAGWRRMKEDSAYENWVVETVAKDLASSDPWSTFGGGSYTIHRFGDSEKTYSYDNWGKDYPGDIKSYLLSELFDYDITGTRSSGNNFWLKLARRKMQSQLQQSLLDFTGGIAQTQGLKMKYALMQMNNLS